MLKLQKYHLHVKYQQGEDMILNDHLSPSVLPMKTSGNIMNDVTDCDAFTLCAEEKLRSEVDDIDFPDYHKMFDRTLQKTAQATEEDANLQVLEDLVLIGRPKDKMNVPLDARCYWPSSLFI